MFLFSGLLDLATTLQILHLESNTIQRIPVEVFHLVQLTHLNLSSNNLYSVANEIGVLNKLVFLDLSRNRLTQLPDTWDHRKLEHLVLYSF